MSLRLINQVVKQQKRLLIITNFLVVTIGAFSQKTDADTSAFKKDFEKLLLKYGIKSKGYLINVTSVNQKGGQTAFVINNNYFGDTLNGRNNFGFRIDTINKKRILVCGPLKEAWLTPFFAMDSANFKSAAYNPGIGVMTTIYGLSATIENKEYNLLGIASHRPISQMMPMYINLSELNPNVFFIFGDFQDPLKTYIYHNGQISYFGDEGDGQKKGVHSR